MTTTPTAPHGDLDPRPRFPDERGGVAILGCGSIAQSAHLPAYEQYGVGVVGVWARSPATVARLPSRFPGIGRVYRSPEELLADPQVRIVDIATPTRGRLAWIEAAVDAGKHVLAQKPLTDDPAEVEALVRLGERAEAAGVRVAVNQNGRWAPPWRLTTQLLRAGAVGEVVGVTHLHDKPLPPLAGTSFDDLGHMLVTDYLNHWIDVTRGWLTPARVHTVQAVDTRVPGQPASARNPWSATVTLIADSGATAVLRITGDVVTARPSCPFWVHGTRGTVRGSVLLGSDRLSLDDGSGTEEFALPGQWFVDGFAGAMAELMTALDEDREPEHAVSDVLGTVRVMLAARDSAERGGAPVDVEDPPARRAGAP
ncbi:Gfo/Idh/MocA family protein [Nocardioides gansuensis]|uniref:Gfo/Idh/MocA family protein n=1 Tax=Nocardioides gansuensis TaxID=2138300 RepID=UPI001403CC1A|nr:Gfo/Idh/MocA family oxidoreductase [Nocardioides gansuensis]